MIRIDKFDCISCGQCAELCPNGAIELVKEGNGYGIYQVNQKLCVQCMTCLDFDCPGDAFRYE